MTKKAFICGVARSTLEEDERKFLEDAKPWGVILFSNNVRRGKDTLARLIDDIKTALGDDALILVDQEGGRIQRLKPPHWLQHPSAAAFGSMPLSAITEGARAIGAELFEMGINVDCYPVMDVPIPGANDIIGDRAYSHDPVQVAAMGRAAALGMIAAGVLPVIKHMPGHGRSMVDSHMALPTVTATLEELAASDFIPFIQNNTLPMGMVAHIVYKEIDPDHPASQSSKVVRGIIRERIGFNGILMTDDLTMEALSGTYAERAKAALDAGIDVALLCNDTLEEARAVAEVVPDVSERVAKLTSEMMRLIA